MESLNKKKKYGSNPELDKLVDSKVFADRVRAARQGYGLDILQ
ncbi:hypothetical protein [Thomasclavelia ramosa]|jgi:hypothetical protein|nr:hypothetical protein MBAG_03616 [Coprobacillus sp. D7]